MTRLLLPFILLAPLLAGCVGTTDPTPTTTADTAPPVPTLQPIEPGAGFRAVYESDTGATMTVESEPSRRVLAEDGSHVLVRRLKVDAVTWSLDASSRVVRREFACGFPDVPQVCVNYMETGALPPLGFYFLNDLRDGSADFIWHGVRQSVSATVDVDAAEARLSLQVPTDAPWRRHVPFSLTFNHTGPAPLKVQTPDFSYRLQSFSWTLPHQPADTAPAVRLAGTIRGLDLPPGSDKPLGGSGKSIQEALNALRDANPAPIVRDGCVAAVTATLGPAASFFVGPVREDVWDFTFTFSDSTGQEAAWKIGWRAAGPIGRWLAPEPAEPDFDQPPCATLAAAPAATLSIQPFVEAGGAILARGCCNATDFAYARSHAEAKGHQGGAVYGVASPSKGGDGIVATSVVSISADVGTTSLFVLPLDVMAGLDG